MPLATEKTFEAVVTAPMALFMMGLAFDSDALLVSGGPAIFFFSGKINMDRIRTVYIDSAYAEEAGGVYNYNTIGGMSVPEGSRVYVDNISFTNTFSNNLNDKNDQVFLKTATNTAKVTPADRTYDWTYTGFPTDRLLSGKYDLKVKGFTVDLTATAFHHGTYGAVTFTPVAAVPGEYTFVISNVTYNLFI